MVINLGVIFFIIGFAELSASMGGHFNMRKPFNCSYCLTFWYSLPIAYLAVSGYDLEILSFIGYALIIRQIAWKTLY